MEVFSRPLTSEELGFPSSCCLFRHPVDCGFGGETSKEAPIWAPIGVVPLSAALWSHHGFPVLFHVLLRLGLAQGQGTGPQAAGVVLA